MGQLSPSDTRDSDHPLLKISSSRIRGRAVGTQLGSGGRLMIISARRTDGGSQPSVRLSERNCNLNLPGKCGTSGNIKQMFLAIK